MRRDILLSWFLWVVAFLLLVGAGALTWAKYFTDQDLSLRAAAPDPTAEPIQREVDNFRIPDFVLENMSPAITREIKPHTMIPERENIQVLTH